jgi:hypothetical protein
LPEAASLPFPIEHEGFRSAVGKLVFSSRIDQMMNAIRTNLRQIGGLPDMNPESTERDRCRMTSLLPLASLCLAAPLVLAGCSHAPEYSIFGSFFPAWIFCSAGGLVLATGARALIVRTALAEHLAAPVLFYLSMAIFLACMLWLLFYS